MMLLENYSLLWMFLALSLKDINFVLFKPPKQLFCVKLSFSVLPKFLVTLLSYLHDIKFGLAL